MRDNTSPPAPVFVVDGDREFRSEIRMMLEADGRSVEEIEDGEAFVSNHGYDREGCLLVGADLPRITGLDLLKYLSQQGQMMVKRLESFISFKSRAP